MKKLSQIKRMMQSTNLNGATQNKAIFSQDIQKGMDENEQDSSYIIIQLDETLKQKKDEAKDKFFIENPYSLGTPSRITLRNVLESSILLKRKNSEEEIEKTCYNTRESKASDLVQVQNQQDMNQSIQYEIYSPSFMAHKKTVSANTKIDNKNRAQPRDSLIGNIANSQS